jgi:DNA-3-methyladenine glycosylase II
VVVDECLSIQNDMALQTSEAWRQVISSVGGVLMLSATFFRSKYSKLFYMVRMLKSPIPRTLPYLNCLLREHIICFVPEHMRTWKLIFCPVALQPAVMAGYNAIVEAFVRARSSTDYTAGSHSTSTGAVHSSSLAQRTIHGWGGGSSGARKLYSDLKSYLREHYEPTAFVTSLQEEVERSQREGRRVLVFANSDTEARERVLPALPNARQWRTARVPVLATRPETTHTSELEFGELEFEAGTHVGLAADGIEGSGTGAGGDVRSSVTGTRREENGNANTKVHPAAATGPLVITVHRGATGLNLQSEADCIVCRPQPGDLIEQMKGRIDRPGQARTQLQLVVLYAAGTVEEAEAANIKLCGSFFRQYLDPLSVSFHEGVAEATVFVQQQGQQGEKKGAVRGGSCRGLLAQAFHRQLRSLNTSMVSPAPAERRAGSSTERTEKAVVIGANAEGTSPHEAQKESRKRKNIMKVKPEPGADPFCVPFASFDGGPEESGVHREEHRSRIQEADVEAKAVDLTGNVTKKRKTSRGKSGTAAKNATKKPTKAKAARRKRKQKEVEDDEGEVIIHSLQGIDIQKVLKHLSQSDPKLGSVIAQVGPPTAMLAKLGGDPFQALCKSVVFQQLSVAVAAKIFDRVLQTCTSSGTVAFTPASLLSKSFDELKKAGLSKRKVEYLQSVATAFTPAGTAETSDGVTARSHGSGSAQKSLSREVLQKKSDAAVIRELCKIKGIGEWSAHMFMMFCLGRANILPVGDLAIRKAMKRLYNCGLDMHSISATAVAEHMDLPDAKSIEAIAEKWRPYRTLGSWYMWHVLETKEAAFTF